MENTKITLARVIKEIEADAESCEKDAQRLKEKGDGINSYLMGTQAMAHRLDIARIKKHFKI